MTCNFLTAGIRDIWKQRLSNNLLRRFVIISLNKAQETLAWYLIILRVTKAGQPCPWPQSILFLKWVCFREDFRRRNLDFLIIDVWSQNCFLITFDIPCFGTATVMRVRRVGVERRVLRTFLIVLFPTLCYLILSLWQHFLIEIGFGFELLSVAV